MDLFGRKKGLATKAAVDFLRPLFGILQHFNGVPSGFWHDEFVVGFAGSSIGLVMRDFDLTTEDKGRVLAETFTNLSNINGVAIGRRFTELVAHPTADFDLGVDTAFLILGYAMGRLKNEAAIPSVEKATAAAQALGMGSDRNQILALLTMFEFYNVIKERFKSD